MNPKIAILDETDSGLDIDALRVVSEGVNKLSGPELGVLVITHYQRILNYIQPDFVHVMFNGRIVENGGADLALKLEETGYDWVRERFDVAEEPNSEREQILWLNLIPSEKQLTEEEAALNECARQL